MNLTNADRERLITEIRSAAEERMPRKLVFTVAEENHLLPLLSWLYLEYGIVGAESCRSAIKKIEEKTKENPNNLQSV